MRVEDETWAAIMTAYAETTEPVRQIAARFGVGRSTIHERALRERWPERPSNKVRITPRPAKPAMLTRVPAVDAAAAESDGAGGAGGCDPAGGEGSPPLLLRREPDSPEVRILRLLRVIDMQIDNMEKLMSSGEALSPQDLERNARAMTATLGNMEKATETANELLKPEARTDGEAHHERTEAERMRREIAERLERLSAQWHAQTKPE